MEDPSRRGFLKLRAAVAGGAVAFRSMPMWAAPGTALRVVSNYSALSDLRNRVPPMTNVEAKA